MKKTLAIILLGVLIISCSQTKKKQKTIKGTENFDWLLGKWKRLNEEEGKETFENWEKVRNIEYSGIGYTMQHGDTIKQEKIRLTKTNGKWNLIVTVPEEPQSITFNGINHSKDEFSCENKEIDFPNTIKYWKSGNKMNAMVSGKEIKILFEFEKLY